MSHRHARSTDFDRHLRFHPVVLIAVAAAAVSVPSFAADFPVTTTADSGAGSLRQAIDNANAAGGGDRIVFAIPEGQCGNNGVCEITLSSPLPEITVDLDIDGRTQSRYGTAPTNVCATPTAALAPRIQIWGDTDYLMRITSPKQVSVRGLAMGGAEYLARVEAGGSAVIQCNLLGASVDGAISSDHGTAICVGCDGSIAAPSIIGTDGDGVGDEGEGNVFEGGGFGVNINTSGDHVIAGNWFGLRPDGAPGETVGTGVYMRQKASNNRVGSDLDGISDDAERNVFGTCYGGVAIDSDPDDGDANLVVGNWFGVDAAGNRADVRTGVRLDNGGQDHVVADNRFMWNRQAIDVSDEASLATTSTGNCLADNTKALIHRGTVLDLFTASNWWGDATGPSGIGNGNGDEIEVTGEGSVLFTPWLSSPPESCGGTSDDSHRLVIPAAAVVRGAAGSFFTTDLEIHSRGAVAASFVLEWLPRDENNSSPVASSPFTLGPAESRRFADVLGTVFGLEDVAGALLVESDSADLAAMSRTFNRDANGTFGQSLPGVPESGMVFATNRARILFMDENDDFRSNLGLVNGSERPITIRFELFDSTGASLGTGQRTLQAWGNTQVNRVFRPHEPIEAGYIDVWTDTPGGVFTCYGSVLDNQTSDPTTVLPN